MKLKVSKEAILEGFQKVQSIVSLRTTLPILSNVLLKAEKDTLSLSTTDLEVSVRTSVPAKVEQEGATTVPTRRAFNIFRELPSGEIQIEVDDQHTTTIRCGSSRFKVIGISDEEFPPLPKFQGGRSYAVDQGVFREMLRSTGYAASTDETRYVLNGVLLSFKNDKLTSVATDGRRLALVEQEVEFPKEGEGDLVLPTKTVDELIKTLGDEGPLKIQATENQVAFEFAPQEGGEAAVGAMLIVSKLIEGTYPNFKQVIPSQCDERVPVEREALLTAVKRVSLMTSDKGNSIKLSVSKNRVEISAITPEVGEAQESIPVKYNGKELSVAFNPDFLMDPLRTIASDEVFLELTDELSPGVVKCDAPFLYVLMPMRMS
jgi:DNA polymerase-3 subunit beta